jgi:photosystem II stability/assembly factor-like uncharacterized protein
MDVALQPGNPDVVFAVLWAARQAPWEIGSSWTKSPLNGLHKSTDGGTTWRRIGTGLPTAADGLGRIGIATSASRPNRLFAVVGARAKSGVYRSDDAGETWTLVNTDRRLWERDGDFNEIRVDPLNADVAYIANVVTWKTTDGGATFTALRGAPGGDDYHRIWIHPTDPKQMLITSDQGAIITVNGGQTFSSWYNQPTAQFYHVNTDNAFPYRVCGGQQESGSACVASRGRYGQTSLRDWTPVGVEEYGYAVPDPRDPDVVYGGKVTRFDRRTGQVQQVGPKPIREAGYRVVRTAPVVFSMADSTTLFFASNVLWSTRDGGRTWRQRSPDLTRARTETPPSNLGTFAADDPEKGGHRGVIYTIAPSPRDAQTIWVGTDDGLIHVTSNGGLTWSDVTPPGLAPWSKISIIDASHFDSNVAYAAVNTFRLDDLRPHIYRTTDRGRTWQRIVTGIPDGGIVNVVREDPLRRGLLFAGTEREVFVSRDDGGQWHSLRRNMPATSIRDLVIKDADVVVATHGRSFWILDDMSLLRRAPLSAHGAPALYTSDHAWRVRANLNTDTPIPQEEPAGRNPPDGVAIDYALPAGAQHVVIEVLTARGDVVRRFADNDPVEAPVAGRNIPDYWIRPQVRVATRAGVHRLHWDLRHAASAAAELGYPIAATFGDTPAEPRGPIVPPGRYRVRLTVDGRRVEQPMQVRDDPTRPVPAATYLAQYGAARALHEALGRAAVAVASLDSLKRVLEASAGQGGPQASQLLDQWRSMDRGPSASSGSRRLPGEIQQLFEQIDAVDRVPTAVQQSTIKDQLGRLSALERGVAALRRAVVTPATKP